MITNAFLSSMFARNIAMISESTVHMSHAQSLLAPHPKANCAHWLVGHLCVYRNRLLRLLGQPQTIPDEAVKRYVRDSAPVHGDEPGLTPFDVLRSALLASQPLLVTGLSGLTTEQSSAPRTYPVATGELTLSVDEWFLFFMRHEAFHTGQIELCAELVK